MVNVMADPFGDKDGDVLSLTNVLKDGTKVIGIVGVQFKIKTLSKIIDPVRIE